MSDSCKPYPIPVACPSGLQWGIMKRRGCFACVPCTVYFKTSGHWVSRRTCEFKANLDYITKFKDKRKNLTVASDRQVCHSPQGH